MFHSMFMNGTVRRADLWFLEYSVFTRTRFEHVYRCPPLMQPHHAMEKAHESLLRERQISVMLSSRASGLRKLKSDGTGQCLYLVLYCSQTIEVCFLPLLFPSQGQGKPSAYSGPTFPKSLGQAANFEVFHQQPQLHNNSTSFSMLQVLVRGSFVLGGGATSLKCNLVIVLVLGSCGMLAH